jgi:xylan 1,4-beta-xylosidase
MNPGHARRLLAPLAAMMGGLVLATGAAPPATAAGTETVTLRLDATARGQPFPHFWEQMFGSGRAALVMRADYQRDLKTVRDATGFKYVRFHAIFHDEVGAYDEDKDGNALYNFNYVDNIYDKLLAQGVRPFVELGFMPKKLASDLKGGDFPFWYHPNVSPPKDYARWDALIRAFSKHLVERYGIDEVAQWYFEVWNEPNIGFWSGEPHESTYYELYDHTARALRAVNPRLRVGGPSTAQAAWAGRFIAHAVEAGVPVDFVSSHVYANDLSQDVFQNDIPVPRDQMVCRAVRKVHDEIKASARPDLPLIFSEYNASYMNEPNVTDSVYMGPWMASTISQCDGLIQSMSYWTFSDVFEEQGVYRTPFFGGFGLIAARNIPKPAFHAFAMLHRLGTQRLAVNSDSALLTRRSDGTLVLALWNYAQPDGTGADYTPPGPPGAAKQFELDVAGLPKGAQGALWRLDRDHGNVIKAFDAMGRPAWPSREQLKALAAAARAPAREKVALDGQHLSVSVPSQGLVVIELR